MTDAAYLHARAQPVNTCGPSGLQPLQVSGQRDSYFYVPLGYDPSRPAPLVVLLHGAGGHAHHGLDLLRHLADDHGLILVAPTSTSSTWDVIAARAYGTDVALIDQSLQQVFAAYAIDDKHLAIGGFSDGASYALSLGLANGDLFTHVIAFSPGFVASMVPRGQPKIFISHGADDQVLPVDVCSRKIVPRLEGAGYDVTYHEFAGPHVIPLPIARQAVDWLLQA